MCRQRKRILVCGNGNVTKRNDRVFLHDEIGRFLADCCELGMTVGYATVILDEKEEKTKNLANRQFPENVQIEEFPSFSSGSLLRKIFTVPVILLKMASLFRKYDFFYCYYPGSIAVLLVRAARIFRKKYALYVRGELSDSKGIRRDIEGASFIFATGCSIVTSICPDYTKCREVAPMSNVFRREFVSEPRLDFHEPLQGLFVGRVSQEKGIYELLEAMKILQDNAVPVTMNLVGSYCDDVAEMMEKLELKNTFLCGLAKNADELQHYYKEADFFCLPTWTEGFPRVLYEAMSYALPCLTTMVGGIPSRMRDNENCIALQVRKAVSIEEAIRYLVTHQEVLPRLSAASQATFHYWKKQFHGCVHAKQLLECLYSNNKIERE